MVINPNYYYLSAKHRREISSQQIARIAEVQRRARSAAIEAGCESVPTDLVKLARFLGVTNLREVPLAMRGRLMNEEGRLTIEVNTSLSRYEKRQTIAHELGHVLVEKKALWLTPQRSQRSIVANNLPYAVVERLCDAAAAEILIPLSWLEEAVSRKLPSLDLINTLAEQTDTSIEAVASRLYEENLWRCRIILWRNTGNSLLAIKSYPYADEASLARTEPVEGMNSLLGQCAKERRVLQGKESIKISGESYCYNIQCAPIDDTSIISVLLF